MVNILLVMCIIAPSVIAIIFKHDIYPYSNYTMYSRLVTRSDIEVVLLYGVPTENGDGEIQLASHDYIEPFEQGRIRRVIDRLSHSRFSEEQRHEFLDIMLKRYESRREARDHDGPPLRGLRVYRVRWELQADAANRNEPTDRVLLYGYEP